MIGELCSSLETEAKAADGLYGDEERPQLFRLVRGWQNRVHLLLRQRLKVKIFRCLQFMNRHVWGGHEGFAGIFHCLLQQYLRSTWYPILIYTA